MKILGISENSYTRKYIAEIDHNEIERYMKQFKIVKLDTGCVVNMQYGYDITTSVEALKSEIGDLQRRITILSDILEKI